MGVRALGPLPGPPCPPSSPVLRAQLGSEPSFGVRTLGLLPCPMPQFLHLLNGAYCDLPQRVVGGSESVCVQPPAKNLGWAGDPTVPTDQSPGTQKGPQQFRVFQGRVLSLGATDIQGRIVPFLWRAGVDHPEW